MLGAEKSDQLCHFVMGERVAEAGHLLAAVFDLGRDLRGLHGLANIGQRWSLLSSLSRGSVAVGAAFIVKKDSSRFLLGFGRERECGVQGEGEEASCGQNWQPVRKAHFECSHIDDFLICRSDTGRLAKGLAQFSCGIRAR